MLEAMPVRYGCRLQVGYLSHYVRDLGKWNQYLKTRVQKLTVICRFTKSVDVQGKKNHGLQIAPTTK